MKDQKKWRTPYLMVIDLPQETYDGPGSGSDFAARTS